jgi:hypothetical protein
MKTATHNLVVLFRGGAHMLVPSTEEDAAKTIEQYRKYKHAAREALNQAYQTMFQQRTASLESLWVCEGRAAFDMQDVVGMYVVPMRESPSDRIARVMEQQASDGEEWKL